MEFASISKSLLPFDMLEEDDDVVDSLTNPGLCTICMTGFWKFLMI